ncbi:MAG: argininosuccinate lyase [Thermus sp.]|uniref:argininosuccinate lyase n=1 Tax=Thermus sp. TaxID=275 RepID=UPI00332070D4
MSHRTWGGRFEEGPDALAARFNASLPFDRALWREDLWQNRVQAEMLHRIGLLSKEELEALLKALSEIEQEIEEGRFPWREALEDVHMNLEARLMELAGPAGAKIHTARSRNDQVATDLRLHLRRRLGEVLEDLLAFRRTLVKEAERHLEPPFVLPGYTHLQRAQPILLSHWFLAYYEMATRDEGRLKDAQRRLNESPLGAAALAGTGFSIDRFYTAKALGFDRPMRNSLDAVASRDFALEVLSALNIAQLNLSRMAEELILYSTEEFGFVEVPDAFATGSSIMPQKKNPDILELIRAKAGRVLAALVGLSTVVKGLPLAYNKDLQEDKEPLWDALTTYQDSLRLLTTLLPGLKWNRERMWKAAEEGFALATELADFLAQRGVPFREAHHVVGRLVRRLIQEGRGLKDLSLDELRTHHPLFSEEALPLLRLETAIHARASYGGTAPRAVRERVLEAKEEVGLD